MGSGRKGSGRKGSGRKGSGRKTPKSSTKPSSNGDKDKDKDDSSFKTMFSSGKKSGPEDVLKATGKLRVAAHVYTLEQELHLLRLAEDEEEDAEDQAEAERKQRVMQVNVKHTEGAMHRYENFSAFQR